MNFLYKPAKWWQFWRPQSGLVGGIIIGAIIGAIVWPLWFWLLGSVSRHMWE